MPEQVTSQDLLSEYINDIKPNLEDGLENTGNLKDSIDDFLEWEKEVYESNLDSELGDALEQGNSLVKQGIDNAIENAFKSQAEYQDLTDTLNTILEWERIKDLLGFEDVTTLDEIMNRIYKNKWWLRLPLGSRWKFELTGYEEYDLQLFMIAPIEILKAKRRVNIKLQGEFTMKQLPKEKTFSKFIETHQPPAEAMSPALSDFSEHTERPGFGKFDISSLFSTMMKGMEVAKDFLPAISKFQAWTTQLIKDGYYGIEGTVSGSLEWIEPSVAYTSFGVLDVKCDGFEVIYPIKGIVRGGFWLDGIALFINKTDSYLDKWQFTRTKTCTTTNKATGDVSTRDQDVSEDICPFWFYGENYSPGFKPEPLDYSAEPQKFIWKPNVERIDYEYEIRLIPNCPISRFALESRILKSID